MVGDRCIEEWPAELVCWAVRRLAGKMRPFTGGRIDAVDG